MVDKSRKELLYDHFNYSLYVDDLGNYDLEIVANHSAFYYLVDHRLTAEEVEKYKKRGKKFIDSLANKYRYGTK